MHQYLLRQRIDRSDKAAEELATAALDASHAERRAMEVERGVTDLYRCYVMKDRIGERLSGVVTAVVGSGLFVAIGSPFIDVLVKLQDLGAGEYQPDDDGLRVVASRSGDAISLGDEMMVEITEVSLIRRTIYARRLGGEPASARHGGDRGGAPFHERGGAPSRGKKGGRGRGLLADNKPGQRPKTAKQKKLVDKRIEKELRRAKKKSKGRR